MTTRTAPRATDLRPQDRAVPGQPRGSHGLRLLDGFALVRSGADVPVTTGSQRLVALLGLEGPRHRSVAAGLLWPEVTEEHAHGRLRTALWRLQRVWPGLVDVDHQHLRLDPEVRLDTDRFAAHALRVVDGPDDLPACELTVDAVEGGELLPGWYDEWVVFERERLRQLRLHALEALSARLVRRGRYALALEAALSAIRVEPLRESAHRAAIVVHLAEGNVVEARRHHAGLCRLLAAELGVRPSADMTALVQAPPSSRSR